MFLNSVPIQFNILKKDTNNYHGSLDTERFVALKPEKHVHLSMSSILLFHFCQPTLFHFYEVNILVLNVSGKSSEKEVR